MLLIILCFLGITFCLFLAAVFNLLNITATLARLLKHARHVFSNIVVILDSIFNGSHTDLCGSDLINQFLWKTTFLAIIFQCRPNRAGSLQIHLGLLVCFKIDINIVGLPADIFLGELQNFFNHSLFALGAVETQFFIILVNIVM